MIGSCLCLLQVKETRKAVRDSESGVEKMAVGHHINDRAHVIERSRNVRTGEENENQDYINIDEGNIHDSFGCLSFVSVSQC